MRKSQLVPRPSSHRPSSHRPSSHRPPSRRLALELLCRREMLAADVAQSPEPTALESDAVFYSIDGAGNNLTDAALSELGSTHEPLLRLAESEYADGLSAVNDDLPSARLISNLIVAQSEQATNDRHLTDLLWLWGQFIDHDLDLTESAGNEPLLIEVPSGDPWFDPDGTGDAVIATTRSIFDESTGTTDARQQVNEITAWLDGSVIYGSDDQRAAALREGAGGRLATSDGDLLPFNTQGLANAGGVSDELFLAGDVRANENIALTAMHTLWVREHNRIADEIATSDPTMTDEEIFQAARRVVVAELQAITYNEFLPALLGADAVSEYQGYDASVNPNIANEFSTAAYRFGHSMLSSELLRLNADGTTADEGTISLQNAFFSPDEISQHGIDSILMGALTQEAQEIDNMIVDDVRNFLFGPPGSGGFDLASLNIQRGRDHGLADYNDTREALGLERAESFADITSDASVAAALEEAYGDVDQIDLWVGGLAEDAFAGGSLGELFTLIIADQFSRIRDGDRLFYLNSFQGDELRQIENTTLADVIARNTGLSPTRDNLFFSDAVQLTELRNGREETVLTQNRDGESVLQTGRRQQQVDADAAQLVVEGVDGESNRFVVEADAINGLADGLVVYGGEGGGDELVIHSRDGQADEIIVVGPSVFVNGIEIETAGIERLTIRVDADDVVQTDDGAAFDNLVLDNGQNRDRDRDRNRDRGQDRPPRGSDVGGQNDLLASELSATDTFFSRLGRRT